MQKNRLLTLVALASTIFLCGFLGTKAYHYLENPLRVNEGAWQGKGAFYINDAKVDSSALMLVEHDGIRLSINNQYQNYNYTYDVYLELRRVEHVSKDFDIQRREVRGLESFVKNTAIDIPLGGNLIRVNAWHLDEGRIFIEIEQSNDLDISYILARKSVG